jgi:hypothetical protein
MEIVPGIHRLEPYLGQKLLAHHLIVGEKSLLVDAGTPDLAFALEAHLTWFEQTKRVQRLNADGRAAWRWLAA